MSKFTRLLLIASLLAIPLFAGRVALAQQYAQNTTVLIPLDAGVGTETFTGTGILLNYQPTTVTCVVSTPAHSSSVGTIGLALSPDGVNFGADGGPILPFSCSAASTCGTTMALSPTNPYLYGEIVATATQDGGASAGATCIVSVVQTQTLHSAHSTILTAKHPPAPGK